MSAAETLLAAAKALADARVRYAKVFLAAKIRKASDGQAHQQAIEQTKDEITVLEAEVAIARHNLG